MAVKSWHLQRRTFLRGAGVSLTLPFMNAMASGGEQQALESLPKRAAFIFFPNGVSLPPEKDPQHEDWYWFPKGEGKNYEFRTSQASLNPYREDISVISGLSHPQNRNSGDAHVNPTGFMTSKDIVKGKTTFNSISIDQVISNFYGGQTQLASMPLSTVGGVGNLTRTYTLSFDKNGQGIPAWSNLKEIYERMYVASSPAAKARLREKTHLLNEIYRDAKDLKRNLGQDDQATLDEYLESITELERKVANDKLWADKGAQSAPPEMNLNIEFTDVENYIRTMYDLMYLAFKSDITRVATYQLASEGGTAPTNNLSKRIGIAKDLHQLSHSAAKNEDGFKSWGLWDQFVARQLAYFIKRLKDTKEGDGSLLDRCLVFQGAATSKVHDNTNFPLVLAGGKKMGHKAGQFVTYNEKENALSNLFVRIANSMDVPIERFGDSTGIPMSELFV
ncbi:MAG: DUF1552 domain-containing protein [Rubripirellula sp.]|jgi:hypothetical protein|nr:DUF1552 domain-containing protein [Rubripirellula sp.]